MKPRKILERILNGSQNIAFADMVSLVKAYGFRLDRIRGSHQIFVHDRIRERINLQPVRGQVKPYQIRQVMTLIEEYDLVLGDEE